MRSMGGPVTVAAMRLVAVAMMALVAIVAVMLVVCSVILSMFRRR